MPFQPIDFARIDPQGNPFLRDFVQNLAAGYKAGQLPQQLERQGEQERLANAMQSLLVLRTIPTGRIERPVTAGAPRRS